MSKPKRHHFIPQFLLRNYINERGKVWVFRKGGPHVFEAVPNDIALEKHYNSTHENGRRDSALETRLAQVVENRYAPVMKDLIDGIRDRQDIDLPSIKRGLLRLAYMQFTRSKPIKDGFLDQRTGMGSADSQNAYVHMIKINLDCLDDPISFPLPSDWESYESLNLGVMQIQAPKKSFVVGDIPLVRGSEELYFSVAPDIMIYWGRENDEPDCKVFPSGQGNIRRFNEAILRYSTLIASNSKAVIEDLKNSGSAKAKPRLYD